MIHSLRIGNILQPDELHIAAFGQKNTAIVTSIEEDKFIVCNHYPGKWFEPRPITLEILRDNLGFEISDMGDFWQCQKEDFVLIQMKTQLLKGHDMPFIFVLKSSLKEAVIFTEVHHLQNTYLDLKGELLEWKM